MSLADDDCAARDKRADRLNSDSNPNIGWNVLRAIGII